MANDTPLERVEQAEFVQWLERQQLRFTATAQSTFTTSWNQKRINHETGLRKGFPDMVVVVPQEKSVDGEGYLLMIEMKRQKGGVVSKEQKEWHEAMNGLGILNVQTYVTKGADEAIKVVSHYLKSVDSDVF